MKRVPLTLPTDVWGSLNTKYAPSSRFVGLNDFTAGSKNWRTSETGAITKRPGTIDFLTTPTLVKDQFEAIFSNGEHHMLLMENGNLRFTAGAPSTTLVTAGYSTVANMEFATLKDRVYFGNGVDQNQSYDRATSYGGVAYTAPKTKQMGAIVPTTAPTAANGGAGNIPAGTITYKVTFLYYDFQESNPGPASTALVLGVASQVNLSSVPVGGYGVTARKIYRSSDGVLYNFVGTISNNTATTFNDNVATGGALAPNDNSLPRTFKYIVANRDRLWTAGIPGEPYDLDFSEANQPDIFPTTNRIQCEASDPIMGLTVYNGKVYILNRHSFGVILGDTSDTFVYQRIDSNAGCVDNRFIQVRTVQGVPVLIWLGDGHFFAFNGSSVDIISDEITNLLQLQIQQGNQQSGERIFTSAADFNSCTNSPGINTSYITANGALAIKGPKSALDTTPTFNWSTQAAWELPPATHAITTKKTTNALEMATARAFTAAEGSNSGTVVDGSNIKTPISTDHTDASNSLLFPGVITSGGHNFKASRFIPPRAGTITSVNVYVKATNPASNFRVMVWRDSGGEPGTAVFTGSIRAASSGTLTLGFYNLSEAVSIATTANENMWIGVQTTDGAANANYDAANSGVSLQGPTKVRPLVGSWSQVSSGGLAGGYTFNSTAIPASGIWTSPVYDSGLYSATVSAVITAVITGSYPSGSSGTLYVDTSDDNTFNTGVTTLSVANPNGSPTFSFSLVCRYWRVRVQLSTTDDRITASVSAPTISFPTTVEWVSQGIDCTSDVTAYNLAIATSVTPSGTSVSVLAASSPDNLTYTAFTTLGAVSVQRYIKLKLVLTSNAGNTLTPSVSALDLQFTVVSTSESPAIDTTSTPAAWDIFSVDASLTGITYQFRTAATAGGLSAASYITVVPGTFPTNTALQFCQWKATLTATAANSPVIDSVTTKWFISTVITVRPASLFFNRSYFASVAEYGNLENTAILEFDENANWRIHRGFSAKTLGLFFNQPFYGSGNTAKVAKFFAGETDSGTNIELDVRTKAMDFNVPESHKIIRGVTIKGTNTGAVYTVDYSTDGGQTFKGLYSNSGSATFTTGSNGQPFVAYLVPKSDDVYFGTTIMLRIRENTAATVDIHEMTWITIIRQGVILNG